MKISKALISGLWYLYVIGTDDGGTYVGISQDVEKRLKSHRKGSSIQSRSLGNYETYKILYTQFCGHFLTASKFERWLQIKFLSRTELEELPKLFNIFTKQFMETFKDNKLENDVRQQLIMKATNNYNLCNITARKQR